MTAAMKHFRIILGSLTTAGLLLLLGCKTAQDFPHNKPWPKNWPPRTHDPSTIVHEGSNYWMFCTGKGVFVRRSTNLVNWTSALPVFAKLPKAVTSFLPHHRGWLWAPDLIRVKGRWLLYYSISEFGKNTSAIALASNATLDPAAKNFTWRDEGLVVTSVSTNDFNTIDPAVFLDDEGRLWLAFGSFWSGIKLMELDPATGKRLDAKSPLISLARSEAIEAASIAKHEGEYYLFVNWGICCRGTNSTYEIRVGRSQKITGPYLDRDGKDLRDGGGTEFLASEGRFIGPGHASVLCSGADEYVSFHFYDGDRRGAPTLGIRRLTWDDQGWPMAGEWISPPQGSP